MFNHIRNEELTPLERIEKSIRELNVKLSNERDNLSVIVDPTEFIEKSNEIVNLERTLGCLIKECLDRQKKLRRGKYMHEIVSIRESGRHFGGFKRRLDSFLLRINRIDTDIGPFRWSDRPRIKRFEMLCF